MSGTSDPQDLLSGLCTLTDEDISAIQALERRHKSQAIGKDFDSMAEDIAEDFIVWAPNQPDVAGKSGLREWQRAWEGVAFDSYELLVEEIMGCGDLAFVKGSYSMAFTPEGGTGPIEDSGRWIHLLRKTPEGHWVIMRDMFNSERPLQTG